ncbi:MAG: ribosome maturation factor RimP [Bacilli bacterium]|nr:ribosome maturation factor RimP [Bacilli bacterium]MBN2877625.1 ribosome maturation factor RimP [Bacilli bacterium]
MDLKNVKEKLGPFLENLGYTLYDLEYKPKKTGSILTVYIDSDHDITLDDCVLVTNELNPYIDELDPIPGEYFLEVSSPGAEKELRDATSISRAVGRFVHIETYEQKMEGTLELFDGNDLTLRIKNKTHTIHYEDVNLIRLAIKF